MMFYTLITCLYPLRLFQRTHLNCENNRNVLLFFTSTFTLLGALTEFNTTSNIYCFQRREHFVENKDKEIISLWRNYHFIISASMKSSIDHVKARECIKSLKIQFQYPSTCCNDQDFVTYGLASCC